MKSKGVSKKEFKELIESYQKQRERGVFNNTSEEDMRAWIDDLLNVFGWNTKDPLQVSKNKRLSAHQRQRLNQIGARHNIPDYSLKNGGNTICFVDAKNLGEDIFQSDKYAYQIRCYGYSANVSISILTNFEQIVVYDCRTRPNANDRSSVCRIYAYRLDEYLTHYEDLVKCLGRENLSKGIKLESIPRQTTSIDKAFSEDLKKVRLEIGTALAAAFGGGQNLPHYDLNYLTQTIINRVLFIRICEARGLEKDELLKDFDSENFWQKFSESSYGNFYKKYDGPLFTREDKLKNVSVANTAFSQFLSLLYFPTSPYCFDVISLKSISDIYDLFLGYQLDYDASGNVVDKKRIDVSKLGSVTTPKEVVDKVISCTLGRAFSKRLSYTDILGLKILDPACGSGSFLLGVFDLIEQTLIAHNKKWFSKKTTGHCKNNGRCLIDIEGRKEIMRHCIFGVDINREAVEVAKLSLSLRILDGYEYDDFAKVGLNGALLLNGVGENIKCGNTLVDEDILEFEPTLMDPSRTNELVDTNIFNWKKAFPVVFNEKGGFDFIVGNPPYVEVKNYNNRLPTMSKYIKHKYESCKQGKIDLSVPFIEKSLSLLSEQGILGLLTQRRFFKTEYGEGLRNLLTKNRLIKDIYDYDDHQVFDGLNTYVCIVVCGNNSSEEYLSYTNLLRGKHQLIPIETLEDNIWCLEDYDVFVIAEQLKKSMGTLNDVRNISDGIQVLWKSVYQIKPISIDYGRGLIKGVRSDTPEKVTVEIGACRPLVRNEDLYPFAIPEVGMYAIFPYDVNNGIASPIQFSEFSRRFPKAARYLRKHRAEIENGAQTVPRRYKTKSPVEDWHLYTRCSHLGENGPKICIPTVKVYPQADIIKDSDVYLDNSNIYFLPFDNGDIDLMYAVAAIVNSTPYFAFSKTYTLPQRNEHSKFNKQALEKAPFPTNGLSTRTNEITRLSMIGKQLEGLLKNAKSLGTLNDRIQPAINKLWDELDTICYSLYGITDEQREKVFQLYKRNDRNEL